MKVKLLFSVDLAEKLVVADARNLLFNYLFARHHHGQLLVRVDDVPGSDFDTPGSALDTARWMGLDWDSDTAGPGDKADKASHEKAIPLRRSDRIASYKSYADKLVEQGLAYRCYCSRETLVNMTNAQKIHGQTPHYDGRCMRLTPADREAMISKQVPFQIRLKKPEVVSEVHDLVRGRLVYDPAEVADLVVLRYDNTPSLALANVVDHQVLGITHVMRGDRHKAETPREAFLRQVLHIKAPDYIHLPLILGDDRSLLSERHGDKYAEDYRAKGYMADAFINYLLHHGFKNTGEDALRTPGQMVKLFKIEEIQLEPSIWQLEKLQYLNRLALEKFKDDVITQMLSPYVTQMGEDLFARGDAWAKEFVMCIRPSLNTLSDVKDSVEMFFADKVNPEKKGQLLLKDPDAKKVVEALEAAIEKLPEVTHENYREVMDAGRNSILAKSKALAIIRVSLTGRDIGPEFSKLLPLVGKKRLLSRLENTRRYIPKGMKRDA